MIAKIFHCDRKIIEFIETDTGIDAIAEITNKKLISKLRNGNHNINLKKE